MKEIKLLIGEVKHRLAEIEKLMADEEPGKIAVKVNTIQEAKVICNYKGWKYTNTAWIGKETCVIYVDGDRFSYNRLIDHESQGFKKYTVIPFDFFCAQKGLTMPKFVMRSEDGVDLYENDPIFVVRKNNEFYKWNQPLQKQMSKSVIKSLKEEASILKAFVSIEAAEKWIEEQNTKEIVISHTGGNVTVGELTVTFNTGEKCFSAQYFKKIIEAFNSLQQQSDKKS